jgi:diphosphomevalonate decarboxylase
VRPASAAAIAHSNIALAKYWGKASEAENLPAVPSLSLTLAALSTRTRVSFRDELAADEVLLGGTALAGRPLQRVLALLDKVRGLSGLGARARVESDNDFPTASGLASSASGFAALALAASSAAGLALSPERVSALARESSASAARSLYGGYAVLEAGAASARQVFAADHWDLRMLVALVTRAQKETGSSEGMKLTARTSPYYAAWVASAPAVFEQALSALSERNLEALGAAMEHSALAMHASMLAARPGLIYFAPATLSLIQRVRELRAAGLPAYFTIDAGPHVKVLTLPQHAEAITAQLREVPGVVDVLVSAPGPDAAVTIEQAQ